MTTFRPKVDYSLRPAKATVRRMIVEALGKLNPLVPVEQYRYVGMGSIFFRDFQIIHRRLGIADMITLEGDPRAETRVGFNLPLACISPMMASSHEALPKIPLDQSPHIVWLDYESRVNQRVLSDVEEAVGRCAAGSVLIVTANVERLDDGNSREAWLNQFGDEHDRPEPVQPRSREEYALLSYRVLREGIEESLRSRNAALPDRLRVVFEQVFHMVHTDGPPMLTLGGVLVEDSDRERWEECGTGALEFIRAGEEPCEIKVPPLTRREIQYLLSKMPDSEGTFEEAAAGIGIPRRDARQFASVYRYAPLFVEAEDW